MRYPRPMLQIRRVRGEPVVAGGVSVVPVARRVAVGLGAGGGAAWLVHDGPAAVEITEGGVTRTVRIHDVTLLTRVGVLAFLLAASILRRSR